MIQPLVNFFINAFIYKKKYFIGTYSPTKVAMDIAFTKFATHSKIVCKFEKQLLLQGPEFEP
jgi:hypothetical protein